MKEGVGDRRSHLGDEQYWACVSIANPLSASQTREAPFFPFNYSVCLSAVTFSEVGNLELFPDTLAAPGREMMVVDQRK